MKKDNLLVGILMLFIAASTAIAFNKSSVDLYYFNSDKNCVAAPCETVNNSNKACVVRVYSDSNCRTIYKDRIWATDGHQ